MNENDKELLELAAKAADIPERVIGAPGGMYNCDERGWHRNWNPLTDDGDALRLAVKLRLEVNAIDVVRGYVYVRSRTIVFSYGVGTLDEIDHAVRRCIVLAAAEIGKAMP